MPATSAPLTPAPGTSAPGTSVSATSAPGTSAPPTSAPGTAVPTTAAPPTSAPGTSVPPTAARTNTPPRSRVADVVTRTLAQLTLEQRVGQLLMVGGAATGVPSSTRTAVTTYHAGNVMLTGRSGAGVTTTARVTRRVRALTTRSATGGVPLLVATDQEGGAVQVLRGPGFTSVPSALTQGGWTTSLLRSQATAWGRQLRAAGVDVDLAPVADTVPSRAAARTNAPIGRFSRQFGYTIAVVGPHAVAFGQGMATAGVLTSAKHFPGLGRVTGNTDVTRRVTDTVTTRRDPLLAPFRQAVAAGTPLVMMSTAVYARIDPSAPAAFSRTIVTGMLRGDLGFRGVVISDDLGAAAQVAAYAPGDRAVAFVRAGGDVVLTVDPATVPAMYRALLARARTDPAFRAQVDAAVRRVLVAKRTAGLLR